MKSLDLKPMFLFSFFLLTAVAMSADLHDDMTYTIDPVTRYVHFMYKVPSNAPNSVEVFCKFSPAGKNEWQTARVQPLLSDTALEMVDNAYAHESHKKESGAWYSNGLMIERNAAGLERTVIFNPYPQAETDGKVDIDFRVQIKTADGESLSTQQVHVVADNTDVVYIEDWTKVLQKGEVVSGQEPKPKDLKWSFRTSETAVKPDACMSKGNGLYGKSEPERALTQLTYPLDLRGDYAIFIANAGSVEMRLSGDDSLYKIQTRALGRETFWRWSRMDWQDIIIRQRHSSSGYGSARIDYVRFVPLTQELIKKLEAPYAGEHDKFIAAYYEPYSWSFNYKMQGNRDHWEPAGFYADGNVDLFDVQVGRFGSKCVYETRQTDRLIYNTTGDVVNGVAPESSGTGRMVQYTNTLGTYLRYAPMLGMRPHANFGGSNCYVGGPLEGDFSKQHPEWIRSGTLRYEVPEVQAYVLKLFREVLDIGAPGISIDYCRYPQSIDTAETCTGFLRRLRKLADEYSRKRDKHVNILIRFPGTGVRRYKSFDYRTWAKEGLVDYLCPSNIQGRHLNIDMAPYFDAVRGTKCKVLPVIDALSWGLPKPGAFMLRVKQLYSQGAEGLYFYQAEGLFFTDNYNIRRWTKMLGSSEAVDRWWRQDKKERSKRSKQIFLSAKIEPRGYHPAQRVRIWLEGIEMGELEIYLDDKLINHFEGPPYMLGTPDYKSDTIISPTGQKLLIRAKDGNGWLEQSFIVKRFTHY